MDILILGATGLSGTAVTNEALARGHRVVAVHRGGSNTLAGRTDPGLTQVVHDRAGGHAALAAQAPFDAVIDVSARIPAYVVDAIRELDTPGMRWVLYSSVSAYADLSRGPDEDAPLTEFEDPALEQALSADLCHAFSYDWYAAAKTTCERQLIERVGQERAFIMRPGLITGWHDGTRRATYWVERLARAGEALAPPAEDAVQVLDARDLAAFALDSVEQGIVGTYNTAPIAGSTTVGDLIAAAGDAVRATGREPAPVHHATAQQLAEHGVEEWSDMPAWLPVAGEFVGMVTADTSRAHAAGYRTRPIAETMEWVLKWLDSGDVGAIRLAAATSGLHPAREREVLAALSGVSA